MYAIRAVRQLAQLAVDAVFSAAAARDVVLQRAALRRRSTCAEASLELRWTTCSYRRRSRWRLRVVPDHTAPAVLSTLDARLARLTEIGTNIPAGTNPLI